MTSQVERREKIRDNTDKEKNTVIEIRHTFGSKKKSLYRVHDYNEKGLSFIMPQQDGYFMAGTPLKFTLPNTLHLGHQRFGMVRYYAPYFDEVGGSYYKIGVEIMPEYRDIEGRELKLRPPRYKSEELNEKPYVEVWIEGEKYTCEVLDLSRYSVAFYVHSSAYSWRIGSIIPHVIVWHKERELFNGKVVLVKVSTTKNENRTKFVVQPRGGTLDVDTIEKQDTWEKVKKSTTVLFQRVDSYCGLDNNFKNAVFDIRTVLEECKSFLESHDVLGSGKNGDLSVEQLDDLVGIFSPVLEKRIKIFDDVVRDLSLSDRDYSLYQQFSQRQLHSLVMHSSFCHRIYCRPLGYPGDYAMMEMIYKNEYCGESLFSKILGKHFTECLPSKANRNRNSFLSKTLCDLIENYKSRVKIMSIASGPAFEIINLIANHPQIANKVDITFLDQEIEALQFAQNNIYESKIKNECTINTTFINQTVGNFVKKNRKNGYNDHYDIIYAFGIFDYLDDTTSIKLIEHLSHFINRGGTFLLSNYSRDNNFYASYLNMVLEWYLIYRGEQDLSHIASQISNMREWSVSAEPTGIIKFLRLDK